MSPNSQDSSFDAYRDSLFDEEDCPSMRNPQENRFGFYSRNSMKIHGTDEGCFEWYPTAAALRTALGGDSLVRLADDAETHAVVHRRVADVLATCPPEKLFDDAVLGPLAEAMEPITDLVWIGTFEDILSGRRPFECDVRSLFRTGAGDEEDVDGPIEPEEIPDFLDYIAYYVG
jgi:hypothetical protein